MSDTKLVDSHCHLIFENFQKDFDEVVDRWRSKGVKKLLVGVKNFFNSKYTSQAFFWIKNQCASMKIRSHGKFSMLKKFSILTKYVVIGTI